ncbi:hypothetical protein QEG98_31125 [Myxococcus sp. MxC21-1]|uniref:hypothetical protein n=1 Tax=Myxococcus sp. MxC21-1 TaxID=3041439 RepID=UPI0029302694|nr:hypothetical protein [Myxococcus sp. MxC21-1]WNZ60408.1 hypothetical protein QEG98_31125 [Myxococcus sp. MxC21-1]
MSLSIAKSILCNGFSGNTRGCGPTDRYQAAYQSMDPSKAAQTVLKHFDAIEGVGMNASGKGAGDNNIGTSELKRVADPNSGFPPDVRAAAKWMLDHPIALRSLDQGASKAHGGNNEVHLSKADLQARAGNASDSGAPQRPASRRVRRCSAPGSAAAAVADSVARAACPTPTVPTCRRGWTCAARSPARPSALAARSPWTSTRRPRRSRTTSTSPRAWA